MEGKKHIGAGFVVTSLSTEENIHVPDTLQGKPATGSFLAKIGGTIASIFNIYTISSSESEGMLMFLSDSSDEEDELLLLVAIEEEQAASQGQSQQRGSVPSHAVIDRGH